MTLKCVCLILVNAISLIHLEGISSHVAQNTIWILEKRVITIPLFQSGLFWNKVLDIKGDTTISISHKLRLKCSSYFTTVVVLTPQPQVISSEICFLFLPFCFYEFFHSINLIPFSVVFLHMM